MSTFTPETDAIRIAIDRRSLPWRAVLTEAFTWAETLERQRDAALAAAKEAVDAERRLILQPSFCGVSGHFKFQQNGSSCLMCQRESRIAKESRDEVVAECECLRAELETRTKELAAERETNMEEYTEAGWNRAKRLETELAALRAKPEPDVEAAAIEIENYSNLPEGCEPLRKTLRALLATVTERTGESSTPWIPKGEPPIESPATEQLCGNCGNPFSAHVPSPDNRCPNGTGIWSNDWIHNNSVSKQP